MKLNKVKLKKTGENLELVTKFLYGNVSKPYVKPSTFGARVDEKIIKQYFSKEIE